MLDDFDQQCCIERTVLERELVGLTMNDWQVVPVANLNIQGFNIYPDSCWRAFAASYLFKQNPFAATDIDNTVADNPLQDCIVAFIPIPAANAGFCILFSLKNHSIGRKVGMYGQNQCPPFFEVFRGIRY